MNINEVREEQKRSVLKTISWRIIATSTTMSLVYILTGQLRTRIGFVSGVSCVHASSKRY